MPNSQQPARASISFFQKLLLLLTGVFASWGAELEKIFNFDISKLYVFLIAGLIFCWLLLTKEKFVFPKYVNLFFLFIFVHTLIVYGLFFRDEFTFIDPKLFALSHSDPHVLAAGYERQESIGIGILRQFIFIISGYAICAAILSKKQLFYFVLAYAAGLSVVVCLGDNLSSGISMDKRVTGGVADPNAFGFSGAMMIFLASIFMGDKEFKFHQKILLSFIIIFGAAVILLSGSRGALLGVIVGLVVSLISSKVPLGKIAMLIFSVVIAFTFVTAKMQRDNPFLDADRYSVKGSLSDHGAGRTDIWHDYVQSDALRMYFFTGVGFGRTREAIRETYTYELKEPHNNYLGTLVNYGVFGFMLFVVAIIQVLKNIRVPAITGLFTMWLISGFFLDTFAIRETWIILAVVCCVVAKNPLLSNLPISSRHSDLERVAPEAGTSAR